MKRIWHRYEQWECVSTMYLPNPALDPATAKQRYADFLSDDAQFQAAIARVFQEWPTACEHFLTDISLNRIAWLGQASAALALEIPRHFRSGFMLLSEKAQRHANQVALTALKQWERSHARKNSDLSESMVQTRLWD